MLVLPRLYIYRVTCFIIKIARFKWLLLYLHSHNCLNNFTSPMVSLIGKYVMYFFPFCFLTMHLSTIIKIPSSETRTNDLQIDIELTTFHYANSLTFFSRGLKITRNKMPTWVIVCLMFTQRCVCKGNFNKHPAMLFGKLTSLLFNTTRLSIYILTSISNLFTYCGSYGGTSWPLTLENS